MVMEMSDLPKGWTSVSLEKCVDILDNERVPINSDERNKRIGKIPYYGATSQVGWIDDFLFNEELLLIGEDGAPFFDKSKSIAYIIAGKSWVNNHAHVLRALNKITSNSFLKYYLNQFDFTDYVNGTTRLKLTQGSMKEIPVLLPPLNEQKRIVAKLDTLLLKVDTAKSRLDKIPQMLKRFRQSVLSAAVSGMLTNKNEGELQKEWNIIQGDDIFEFITSGSRGWAKYYSEKGKLFVRVTNLDYDTIFINTSPSKNIFVSPPKNSEGTRTKVRVNDILISITGDVGMVGLVDESLEEAFVNQHVCLTRPKKLYDAKYLAYYIASRNGGRKYFDKVKKGATKAGLGLDDIRNMRFNIPPLNEQKEIVRRVEQLFKFAHQIEARYNKAKQYVDKLTQSILAKAFRGELVS
jgi:type I restriction enzyme S subunit